VALPRPAISGDYYILPGTGTIQQQKNGLLGAGLLQAGFSGPFNTIADAKAFAAKQPVQNAVHTAGNTVNSSLTGINAVGDFFARLTEPNTWLRAGELLVGVVLVYVSARSMFPAQVAAAVAPVKGAVKGIAGKSILGALL
jgi:hypothetical protein